MVAVTLSTSLLFLGACSEDNDGPAQKSLLERYELSSPDSIPSGFAFDPTERAFYAAGINGGIKGIKGSEPLK